MTGALQVEVQGVHQPRPRSCSRQPLSEVVAVQARCLRRQTEGIETLKLLLVGKDAMNPVMHGQGSGAVVPSFVPTPYDSIRAKLGLAAPPPPPPASCGAGSARDVEWVPVETKNIVSRAADRSIAAFSSRSKDEALVRGRRRAGCAHWRLLVGAMSWVFFFFTEMRINYLGRCCALV